MDIVYINTISLKPYQHNNKVHDEEQIKKIANSIKEFGFIQPLVIDEHENLVIGHGRLEAAKRLLMEKVPCLRVENLSEDQIQKLRILDNKLNESERDLENLKLELESLSDMNFGDLEFGPFDLFSDLSFSLDEDEEEETIEDEPPEVTKDSIVKEGDLFQLGEHRLLCGDSTKIEDFELLMNGEDIDMVFTDPPYNIGYSGVKDKRSIQNDKMEDSDFIEFLKSSLQYCDTTYVCCSRQYSHLFKQAMEELGMKPKAMIIWNKVNPAQNLDKYFKQHEIIFYHGKFGGEKTLRGDIREVKRQKNTVHPTMKPIELISMALKDNPDKKIVYDGFGGSGSTLIACEQLNRKCRMIELDPKYVEVIIKRFKNLKPDGEVKCLNRDIDISKIID